MDTKYWNEALKEWINADHSKRATMKFSDMTMHEISDVLKRAQEIKAADHKKLYDEAIKRT